jgi:hypothetical protein
MYTWEEVLEELDIDSNVSCLWCGKSMILKEAYIFGDDIDHLYLLCGYCAGFDSKEDMEAAKAQIIINAINPELSEQYFYPWI